ncbi:MAG: bifunctional nuclease family protein [Deltaproteobacteria bacterium]|nr:MAG: bifunctional nuclease family protein [Deltaproteobacteria bacterium]
MQEKPRLWEMRIAAIALDSERSVPVVLLRDVDEQHQVPIWIGQVEAIAIASELEGIRYARPMTHDLLRSTIERLHGDLLRVEINDLRDNTFYARLVIAHGGREVEVDSRPSDAIALAIRAGVGSYAHDHVVQAARIDPTPLTRGSEESSEAGDREGPIFQAPMPRSEEEWEALLAGLDPKAFGKYKH